MGNLYLYSSSVVNVLQTSERDGAQNNAEKMQLSPKHHTSLQAESEKAVVVSRVTSDADSKFKPAGVSASTQSTALRCPVGSLRSDSDCPGFSENNSRAESTAVYGNCMNMSADEDRNVVLASEKPSNDAKSAEAKSLHGSGSCDDKQASVCELMEGSFRDELRYRHGDVVPLTTISLPPTAANVGATVNSLKSVSAKPLKPPVTAELVNKDVRSVESNGCTDSNLNAERRAVTSFSDVAKTAAVSANRSSASEVNDSFAYRDRSVVLISDDDDDDDDERDDNTGYTRPVITAAETVSSKQKPTSAPQTSHTWTKDLPSFKSRSTNSEVTMSKVCEASMIITVRPSSNTAVETAKSLSSSVDVENVMAKREAVCKLLNHKKVCPHHCLFF